MYINTHWPSLEGWKRHTSPWRWTGPGTSGAVVRRRSTGPWSWQVRVTLWPFPGPAISVGRAPFHLLVHPGRHPGVPIAWTPGLTWPGWGIWRVRPVGLPWGGASASRREGGSRRHWCRICRESWDAPPLMICCSLFLHLIWKNKLALEFEDGKEVKACR